MPPLNEGAPMPRDGQERWWKVYSPVGYTPLRVVFLAPTFTGKWTHWNGAQLPCYETPDCRHCKDGLPIRWAAYIAAYSLTHKEEIICALTRAACGDLVPTLESGESLRGLTVELHRKRPPEGKKPKPNDRVYCRIMERMAEEKCPKEFEIESSLNRLWGVNESFITTPGQKRADDKHKARLAPGNQTRPLQRGEH